MASAGAGIRAEPGYGHGRADRYNLFYLNRRQARTSLEAGGDGTGRSAEMRTHARRVILPACSAVLVLLTGSLGGEGWADGQFVSHLPDFKLKDPADIEHNDESLIHQGAVVIITIPNVKHGELQGLWSKWLMKKGWPASGPSLVLIEDLSQAERIRERALEGMRKKYRPGNMPVVLLDHTGEVRRSFRVTNDETVLMVFGKDGRIVHTEVQKPTLELAQHVVEIAKELK